MRSIILPTEGFTVYEAGFKKRRSGKLLWVHGAFKTEKEASEKLQTYVNEKHINEGYRLYAGPLVAKIDIEELKKEAVHDIHLYNDLRNAGIIN